MSIPRVIAGINRRWQRQRLRSAHKSRPRADQIIPTYKAYVDVQTQDKCSWEHKNTNYTAGQQRYIALKFSDVDRRQKILDLACGDGVGLQKFREMGFLDVTGVELNPKKAERAHSISGYPVVNLDMHDLSQLQDDSFDIVYSSHTLEHAYYPDKVVREIWRVLKPGGVLMLVLPYPENDPIHDMGHCAKYELGIDLDDGGMAISRYFSDRGFDVIGREQDTERQPEIWLRLQKRVSAASNG